MHYAFLLRTIFAPSARAHERARVQEVRDFPQTKPYSEINAHFLLNKHGDPHFLFYKLNENNIVNNWEKKLAEIYGYFFGKWNKCYRWDITVPTEQVQIMFPLKDKNIN